MTRTALRRAWPSLPLCVAVGAAGTMLPTGLAARGAEPGLTAPPPRAAAPAAALPGPAAGKAADVRPPLPLEDKPYERPSAGISVRAPKGWSSIVEADREEIARFVDDVKKQDWSLVVTRQTFTAPQKLLSAKDAKGEVVPGVVENTLASFRSFYPGAKVLRAGDPTVVGAHDVGVIILRYTKNGERRLAQHAIIEANDQLFYLLALNSPARKDVTEDANDPELTVDPGERQAIETFRNIIDTVKLLDLREVRRDQVDRLFRTRGLFANLTDRRLTQALVPERYLRIVKNGQDVGYSYVTELVGRPVFRRAANADGQSVVKPDSDGQAGGITVGIRTRLMTGPAVEVPGQPGVRVPPYPREDSEAWMYFATDRHGEDWSKITVWDDGKPKTPDNPWRKVSEVGSSIKQVRRRAAVGQVDADHPERQYQRGEGSDLKQPWVETRESYTLNVQFKATRGDLPPVTNPLPPFYVPQGLGALLPRVLPATEPKTYLFATYVSDVRQVMMRYVDVRREEPLPAELLRARGPAAGGASAAAADGVPPGTPGTAVPRGIPIDDRLGYEGTVTTHWVTAQGEYLGSVTKTTQAVGGGVTKPSWTVVVPSDEATLKRIWHIAEGGNLRDLPAGSVQGDEATRGGPAGEPQPAPNGSFINPTGPGTPVGPGSGGLPGKLGPGR